MAWCPSISIVKPRSIITRVVEHICQEATRAISGDFDVNLLPRRITMQEEPCDDTRYVCNLKDGFKSTEQVLIAARNRGGAVVSNAKGLHSDTECSSSSGTALDV